MSSTSSPALILDARVRRAERLLAVCNIALAAAAPLLCFVYAGALSGAAVLCTSAFAAALAAWGLRRAGWLGGPQGLTFVQWTSQGDWILTSRSGEERRAQLQRTSRVASFAVWLRWRKAPRALLLTSFDLPADDLRRLIVRLRMEGPGANGAHPSRVRA